MEFAVPVVVSFVLSTTISLLFPTNTRRTGPKLDDTGIVGSAYGASIPYVRGTMRTPANIHWGLPLREQVNVQKQSAGKGQTVTSTTWSYYGTFAALICQGHELARPLRIWAEKKLIWEAPDTDLHTSGNLIGGGTFEFFPGTYTQGRSAIIEAALGTADTPAYRGRAYVVFSELPVEQFGNRIPTIEVEVSIGAAETSALVADILYDLCIASGLTPSQIDVSEVTQEIQGIRVTSGQAAQTIESLCAGLSLQIIDTGDKIAFRPIEQEVQPLIPESSLLDMGDTDNFPITTVREDQLPQTVQINYLDVDRDYQVGTQSQSRQVTMSKTVLSLDAPMAMDATQAFQIADSALYRSWIAREQYGPFGLDRTWMHLEPGDVIPVEVDGITYTVRIKKITTGANCSRQIEGEAYDSSVLTGNTGGDSGSFTSQTAPTLGDTYLRLMDAPGQNDSEATQVGVRIAATGTGPGWRSGVIEHSLDGVSWSTLAVLDSYSLTGYAITTLQDPPAHIGNGSFDNDSWVDIQLIKGTLASVTDELAIAGANAIMIGQEEIYFANVESIGVNQWRLSRLLRGRRGTEPFMTGHVADETATEIYSSLFVPMSVAVIGQTRQYRVTPTGGVASVPVAFVLEGNSARCFSPVLVMGARDGGLNLTINWTRRSRIGTEFPDAGEIPMDESTELYEVEIMDGADVVRTISSSTPSCTYSAADQTTDFGAPQSSLSVRVYQIGQLVHRSYPAIATI